MGQWYITGKNSLVILFAMLFGTAFVSMAQTPQRSMIKNAQQGEKHNSAADRPSNVNTSSAPRSTGYNSSSSSSNSSSSSSSYNSSSRSSSSSSSSSSNSSNGQTHRDASTNHNSGRSYHSNTVPQQGTYAR